jgi:hypothetical protein
MRKVDKCSDHQNEALLHLNEDINSQARQMEEWSKIILDSVCLQTKTLKKAADDRTSKITSRIHSLESFCRDLQNQRSGNEHSKMLKKLIQEQARLREDIKTLLNALVNRAIKDEGDDDDDDFSNDGLYSASGSSSSSIERYGCTVPSSVTLNPRQVPRVILPDGGLSDVSSSASGSSSCNPSIFSPVDSLVLYGFDEEDTIDGTTGNATAEAVRMDSQVEMAKQRAACNTRKYRTRSRGTGGGTKSSTALDP